MQTNYQIFPLYNIIISVDNKTAFEHYIGTLQAVTFVVNNMNIVIIDTSVFLTKPTLPSFVEREIHRVISFMYYVGILPTLKIGFQTVHKIVFVNKQNKRRDKNIAKLDNSNDNTNITLVFVITKPDVTLNYSRTNVKSPST